MSCERNREELDDDKSQEQLQLEKAFEQFRTEALALYLQTKRSA